MRVGTVALAFSALALGIAVFSLTRESPRPGRDSMRTNRVAALETKVAELTREIESLKNRTPHPIRRHTSESGLPPAGPDAEYREPDVLSGRVQDDKALKAVVDDAVNRKAKQVMDEMRIKANKKPAMEVFAKVLELTAKQRASAERIVVEGQREVGVILDMPTADGTNLKDELIELVALGFAQPGKDHGWRRWFGRVLREKIPGTDETYGARIESVKNAMRATFKREWTDAQYREFAEWKVDPTEIKDVPGSPNAELLKVILERARELGADIPDDR